MQGRKETAHRNRISALEKYGQGSRGKVAQQQKEAAPRTRKTLLSLLW